MSTAVLNRMMASCGIGVWLGYISVVPTTVRGSARPSSQENKQPDAGSRIFSKIFFARCVVVERVVLTVCCGAE